MNSILFANMADEEVAFLLGHLGYSERSFAKDSYIINAGNKTDSAAIVLSGSVLIVQDDYWGNRNIIAEIGESESFAEVFAITEASLTVSAVAKTDAIIAFVDLSKAMSEDSRFIINLLSLVAKKNIAMNSKLTHLGKRTTREKLLSYLSEEARKAGSSEFDIPYNRQQLADYLYVDRCGLSTELSKLQNENLIRFNRNHFELLS